MYQETAIAPLTLLVCAAEASHHNALSQNKSGAYNYVFNRTR